MDSMMIDNLLAADGVVDLPRLANCGERDETDIDTQMRGLNSAAECLHLKIIR
jgi:hypothetical protein